MKPSFFRLLSPEEVAEFKAHARANYVIGDPIDPEGIRHPVWVHEAATMNLEAYIESYHYRYEEPETKPKPVTIGLTPAETKAQAGNVSEAEALGQSYTDIDGDSPR